MKPEFQDKPEEWRNNVEMTYNNLIRVEGQRQHIPYQACRKEKKDPKWMTRILKHEIGLKRRLYRKKKEQGNPPQGQVDLVRLVKSTYLTKRIYELRVANKAKSDPKGFSNCAEENQRKNLTIKSKHRGAHRERRRHKLNVE